MVEEPEIVLENNSIESVINKEVRKIFVVTNIYKVVTYCYNLNIVGLINSSYIIVWLEMIIIIKGVLWFY